MENTQNNNYNANQTNGSMPQGNPNYGAPQGNPNYGAPQGYSRYEEPPIPAKYKPISMWGYFGCQLLFSIPFIGFIFILILAFGGHKKKIKNFARSQFCWLIIVIIIAGIVGLVYGTLMATGAAGGVNF